MSAVSEAFAYQSEACLSLGSPVMGQLCRLLAHRDWPDGALRDRIFDWPGDIGPGGDSVPLRLAGGLHALRLAGHPGLTAVYPPALCDDEHVWQAVRTALQTEADVLMRWIDSAPQTNEVRRSGALIAAGHVVADHFGLPIETSELGASGGLNLMWDRYALQIGAVQFGTPGAALVLLQDWSGPLPPTTRPVVRHRAGVDLNPLNPHAPDDAARLRAYLWPDQAERMTLTDTAIAMAETTVARGDAIAWLESQLTPRPGAVHMIYHTIAWQYFPAAAQTRGKALIQAAGESATDDSPLAWFGMENDGAMRGAALTLRLWPGDITLDLGRADFHGRWVEWNAKA